MLDGSLPCWAGDHTWPEFPGSAPFSVIRVEVITRPFSGEVVTYRGQHWTLESAKPYTLPAPPPPIYVATSGPIQSERTGATCDGIIMVGAADEKIASLLARFERGAREAGKDSSTMPRLVHLRYFGLCAPAAPARRSRCAPAPGMPLPSLPAVALRRPVVVDSRSRPPCAPVVFLARSSRIRYRLISINRTHASKKASRKEQTTPGTIQ